MYCRLRKPVQLVAVRSIHGEQVLQVLLSTKALTGCARLLPHSAELPCLPGAEWVRTEEFAYL